MGDARCPRRVIGLVVLRAERLQSEVVALEGRRRLEAGRDERRLGHDPDATGGARMTAVRRHASRWTER